VLAGFTFGLLVFGAFLAARASDLDLLVFHSSSTPPPNLLFLFDSSGSMNDLICEDFTPACDKAHLVSVSAPNNSHICQNSVLAAVTGPSTAGLGTGNLYTGAYASNGTGYNATRYPVFDGRSGSSGNDERYLTGAIYAHAPTQPWVTIATGVGATTQATIDNAITQICGTISDCSQRNRCIFSLRTQGYFWEPAGSTCGSGNPLNIACSGGGTWGGPTSVTQYTCATPGQCTDATATTPVTSSPCGTTFPTTATGRCADVTVAGSGNVFGTNTVVACPQPSNSFRNVVVGQNSFINTNLGLTGSQGAHIGDHVYIGSNVTLKQGIQIGDYTWIADGASVQPNVSLPDHVCIGAGATVQPNATVGEGATIGPGVTVNNMTVGENAIIGSGCRLRTVPEGQSCGTTTWSTNANADLPVFLGDFLNFYPSKGVGLVKAFSDTVGNLPGDARIAVSDFTHLSGGGVSYGIQPSSCTTAATAACSDGSPTTSCYNWMGDTSLTNYLYALNATADQNLLFAGSTPMAKALDNLGTYLSTSTNALCDYPSGSFCSAASTAVVLITDGLPAADATAATQVPFSNGHVTAFRNGYNIADDYWVDDVAKALAQVNLRPDLSTAQSASTYVVSFGTLDTSGTTCTGLLQEVANAGSGRCYPASSVTALRTALTTIVTKVIAGTRDFVATGVPTVRVSATALATNADFRPSPTFPVWQGHIYAFQICDEKLARDTGTSCACKPTHTGDQICIQDKNGNPVTFDANGYLTSTPYWDTALCLAGNAAGTDYNPHLVQEPLAAGVAGHFDVSGCYQSAASRNIQTAVLSTTTTYSDASRIDFTTANVTAGSAFYNALGAPSVADGQKVVNFFRGLDAYDVDSDGNTTEDRNLNNIQKSSAVVDGWWKLGDIFHSIPATVEHPSGKGLGTWASSASYKKFKDDHVTRDRLLLVGANDGMLHAFQAGIWSTSTLAYDMGTGKELWAFISPELLPRLKGVATSAGDITSHSFLTDGSVMVQDVWTGGTLSKDDAANSTSWKTVAVYGHRDGGSTYVALDITDGTPKLLWVFPQPNMSAELAEMARSWLDTYPAPASIGPLRATSGTDIIDKWVALLSGGFDPTDRTGRMLVALDVATGAVLWELKHGDTGATGMDYSFPATPVFYTDGNSPSAPYIGGIIAADHGGQLWQILTPAQELSGGKFTFTATRFFVAGPSTAHTPIAPQNSSPVDSSHYQRFPFYFAPTLTYANGKLRVVIGTGDRDQLIPHDDTTGIGDTNGYVCTDRQRLYALDVGLCGGAPCTEANLQQIIISGDTGSTYAPSGSRGWFYQLDAGEKVATPFQIFKGYTLFSTFVPGAACNDSATCTTPQGYARLYARHYLSGKPLDWNGDNSIVGETYVDMGTGVPTAPSVSTGVSAAGATPALFAGGSEGAPTTKSGAGFSTSVASDVLRFVVSGDVHGFLHPKK
jgi:Tfp pilus tip-associated adhesin PilY1/acetyltransferase-like isoleucine patch superfamily enzyme